MSTAAISPFCSWIAAPSIVPTMIALTMLLLVRAMHRRGSRNVVFLGTVAGLTVISYPTMKLYVPLLLVAALFIYWRTILRLNREALCYGALVFVLIAGPNLYLSLADPAGGARLDQVSVLNAPNLSAGLLLRDYTHYFSPKVFFMTGSDHPGWTGTPPGRGVEPLALLPFLVAGLAWLALSGLRGAGADSRHSALLVLSALALYPIPGTLTLPPTAHLGRATHLIPLIAIITAGGGVALADLVIRSLRERAAIIAKSSVWAGAVVATALLGVDLLGRYDYYFNRYGDVDHVADYYQYGVEQAVRYAHEHEAEYDEIWLTDINEAYIYVLFYTRWPPTQVHQTIEVQRHPPEFNEVEKLGKYNFGALPSAEPGRLPPVEEIPRASGIPAYEIRAGILQDRGRVLWVHRVDQQL